MANTKISELPQATILKTTDVIPVVNSATTKKTTRSLLNGRIHQNTAERIHTTTTTVTIIETIMIPANTLQTNDVIEFLAFIESRFSGVSVFGYLYMNTEPSITSGNFQLISRVTPTATNTWFSLKRTHMVRDTTIFQFNTIQGSFTDETSQVASPTSSEYPFDKTVDQYFMFCIQLGTNQGNSRINLTQLTIK